MIRRAVIALALVVGISSIVFAVESKGDKKQMNENIICVASFIAKENCADKLYRALSALIKPTRKEDGCISYNLYQGIDNPNLFTMIEHFKDKESFDYHGKQPYLVKFKESVGELIDSVSVNLHKEAKAP